MITLDNYEGYLVMHADGELLAHEEEALQVFLSEHPELKSELLVYEQARLIPDEAIVYTAKESLLKPEQAKRIAFLPTWRRSLGIAAGIAAIIIASIYALHDENASKVNTVASNNKVTLPTTQPATTVDSQMQQPVIADATNTTTAVAGAPDAAHDAVPVNVAQPLRHDSTAAANIAATASRRKKQSMGSGVIKSIAPVSNTTILVPLTATAFQKLPVENGHFDDVTNVAVNNELPKATPTAKKSWIDRLPIEDERKDQLNIIARAVAIGADKAAEIKSNIDETKLTIRVEKRKLILSF